MAGWGICEVTEEVSRRVVEQRVRNRIMEAALDLAEGVDSWGIAEYFNRFFDWMGPGDKPYPNTAMVHDEAVAVYGLCALMNAACDATPNFDEVQYAASPWPRRIEPEAQRTVEIFLRRGRFGEEVEEVEPSFEDGQSWYAAWRSRRTSLHAFISHE